MALIIKWILSREEGVLTLWRGATPTIARAIVVNAAQLGTYSQAKESVKKSLELQDGLKLHFIAAMISGLVTTIASMPVDIVKTRLQNQKVLIFRPGFMVLMLNTLGIIPLRVLNDGFFIEEEP